MKYSIFFILFFTFVNQEQKPRTVPSDLRKISISDFYEPEEILRIWRFPEGGAVFEELIEIKRNGQQWSSIRYTYLLDEFSHKSDFQKFRNKKKLDLTPEQISKFANKKLLQKNIKQQKENQIFLSDMYLAEYRFNDQTSYFEFFLEESGIENSSKINLIRFLDKIISE